MLDFFGTQRRQQLERLNRELQVTIARMKRDAGYADARTDLDDNLIKHQAQDIATLTRKLNDAEHALNDERAKSAGLIASAIPAWGDRKRLDFREHFWKSHYELEIDGVKVARATYRDCLDAHIALWEEKQK